MLRCRVWKVTKDDLVGLRFWLWRPLWPLSRNQLCVDCWDSLLVFSPALQELLIHPQDNLLNNCSTDNHSMFTVLCHSLWCDMCGQQFQDQKECKGQRCVCSPKEDLIFGTGFIYNDCTMYMHTSIWKHTLNFERNICILISRCLISYIWHHTLANSCLIPTVSTVSMYNVHASYWKHTQNIERISVFRFYDVLYHTPLFLAQNLEI